MSVQQQLQSCQSHIQKQLTHELSQLEHYDCTLKSAMQHALLLGGKRIRPFLIYELGQLFHLSSEVLDPLAIAIECIHTYSLVHDDLPAMDDDAIRRGQPTVHIKFDEATALLVGDALQTLAFDVLSRPCQTLQPIQQLKIIQALTRAAGYHGMCSGQALDLQATNERVSLDQLMTIHQLKTGALISVTAEMIGIAASVQPDVLVSMIQFTQNIGLAFQIQDDILDVTSTTEILGKPQGSDEQANKSTYPKLMGLSEAKGQAEYLIEQAIHQLKLLHMETHILEEFALFIVQRDT